MISTATASAQLHQRAVRYVPEGTHSSTRAREPHPFYAERALGAYIWDVDGTRHIDFGMGNSAVMLGHAHPDVTRAVIDSVTQGLTCGVETESAVIAAETMAAMIPGFGQVRFAPTGTEALMHALTVARQATGRDGVAKAEGAYHGWSDSLWVSTWGTPEQIGPKERPLSPPGSGGVARIAAETVVFPFNDLGATEAILREHAHRLAAVVLEPVLIDIGFIPAERAYLVGLRELTHELGIVLIFDELLTGFRLGPGGARAYFGVTPDLTTYGKALGNGYPVAAVEGSPELMQLTDTANGGPVQWVGTFNGHGVAMAAAAAALPLLATGAVQEHLDRLTDRLRDGFVAIGQRHRVPVVVSGMGGHFQPYFMPKAPTDYRSAMATNAQVYRHLVAVAERHDILLAPKALLHGAISAAHSETDVDALLEAADEALSTYPHQ